MGEEIWLDPDHEEATAGASTLVLACMPALNVVTNVWQNGSMSPKQGLEVSSTNHGRRSLNFETLIVHGGLQRAMRNNTFNRRSVSGFEFFA